MMIRTRIAPSPTGEDLHIGNLHTALINWVYAKKHKGEFVVRIEDTDRSRLVAGAEEKILNTLSAYGLKWDQKPYRQSERLELYRKYAEQLIEDRAAYRCYCTKERLDEMRKKQIAEKRLPKYDKHCKKIKNQKSKIKNDKNYVVRLDVPENREIVFNDVIRGQIKFNSNDIDDQVLIKSDGYPTYHLAVVVDDHDMEITHVIRGEDWISSTPKHVLLYEAFGWPLPVYVHTPLLRNPDRSKLSKRKNPVWASWYLEQGYLPEAVLNYLALMGWSHPDEKEIFTLEELVEVFDICDMQAVGPVFDITKLEWMNGVYIRNLELADLSNKLKNFLGDKYSSSVVEKTISLVQERIKKLSDYLPLCEFFFEKPRKYEADLSGQTELLRKIHEELSDIKDWKADVIGDKMPHLAEKEGVKNREFFIALRVAVTGKKVSPPLNESMEILGREECLDRLKSLL